VNPGPLPQRLRLGPVELDRYLAGQLAGLAYMRRLRAIEEEEERHLRALAEAWTTLAEEASDGETFALAWREVATSWSFRRVNNLIAKHNAYYAIEARVPMNPRTGTYSRNWRRSEYGPEWILERFPAARALVPVGDQAPKANREPAPGT
jgi:hypothetical protein